MYVLLCPLISASSLIPPTDILTNSLLVAFAIDSDYKGNGFGAQAWDLLVEAARSDGHSEIQLEVRGDNLFAIEFYRRRGLEIVSTLKGYYNAGIGYVMRGTI